MTTTFGSAVREFQVQCLLRAQDSLAKARASGFDLPDDVALEVQAIMVKIPGLIDRLENVAHCQGAPMIPIERAGRKDLETETARRFFNSE